MSGAGPPSHGSVAPGRLVLRDCLRGGVQGAGYSATSSVKIVSTAWAVSRADPPGWKRTRYVPESKGCAAVRRSMTVDLSPASDGTRLVAIISPSGDHAGLE